MSDEKPALLSIGRAEPHDAFVAVFRIPGSAKTVGVEVPRATAEEHIVEVVRDRLHRLMKATADATSEWAATDERRREIDPDSKPTRPYRTTPSSGGVWAV